MKLVRVFVATLAGGAALACADPVHDAEVESLGPERAGVPKGPEHRPGQPCLACHGGEGPASFEMSVAGTVFAHPDGDAPVASAVVKVADANGRTFSTPSNCVGNFWIPKRLFEPAFPATCAVLAGNYTPVMQSLVNRTGSCNECHSGPPSDQSPGRIWVYPTAVEAPSVSCGGSR
jgi:hypothetical protein